MNIIHLVAGAGIRTRDLCHMSHRLLPLDQGFWPFLSALNERVQVGSKDFNSHVFVGKMSLIFFIILQRSISFKL